MNKDSTIAEQAPPPQCALPPYGTYRSWSALFPIEGMNDTARNAHSTGCSFMDGPINSK